MRPAPTSALQPFADVQSHHLDAELVRFGPSELHADIRGQILGIFGVRFQFSPAQRSNGLTT